MSKIVFGSVLVMLAVFAITASAQLSEVHVPVPDGWIAIDQEYRYDRETLWQYINGAAELFLSYRFRELVVADFEQGDGAITVYVYDMSRPLDAFGIFEAEKPTQATVVEDVGSAALLQAPYRALMIKDRFYVKIEVGSGDVSSATLRGALQDVAAGLPGDSDLPPELASLPEEGRVPGTVAFAGSDFLGFEDLSGCLYADYEDTEGEVYRLFVMEQSNRFLRTADDKWTRSEHEGQLLFTRSIPYRGVVVLLGDEERMIGACGFETVAAATEILDRMTQE